MTVKLLLLIVAIMACSCANESPKDDSTALLDRGRSLIEAKRFDEAAAVLRKAVRANPLEGRARLALAEALWRAQNWSEGAQEAIRAADLLPEDKAVQLLAASRALTLRRFTEAAARAEAVIRLEPDNIEARLVFANALAQLQDSTWALYYLRNKARRRDSFEAALRDVRPRTSSVDDARAEKVFREALKMAPGAYETRVALVNFQWATGRPDDAAEALRAIADEQPGNLVFGQALGEYYLSRGSNSEGERYLKQAAASGDRQVRLELADFYSSVERDDEAWAILDGFDSDEPPGSVSLPRAAIEMRRRQYEAALARLDGLLARVPQHTRGLALRAECLLNMNRESEALEVARAAVAAGPSSSDAHLALGRALLANQRPEEAFESFTQAARIDPLNIIAAKARASQALALGQAETAAGIARTVVRTAPEDFEATRLLVAALVRANDPAALTTLNAALARFPRSGELLARQGDLYVAKGRPGARVAYEQALRVDAATTAAVCGLALLDLAADRPDAARRRVEGALELTPNALDLIQTLGLVLEKSGDRPGAESAYRRLLAVDPGHIAGTLRLAELLQQHRRESEAIALLEQLVARRPAAAEPRVELGAMLEEAGRHDDAQTHYQKALEIDARAGIAAYRLAALQAERGGNLDIALGLAVRAVQVRPADPRANDVLGWIYVRKNLPRIGRTHLEACVKTEPRDPVCRYHLGVAYVALGQTGAGRLELQKALELDPGFRFASEARAALAALAR